MKKFRIPSLILATILSSFLIYSCMKEDSVLQQATSVETKQQQTNIPFKAFNDIPHSNKTNKSIPIRFENQNTTNELFGEGDCLDPEENDLCTTYTFTEADDITVNMPATTLNPYASVAILTFTMTVCLDPSTGIARISYRNVRASNRDWFPIDPVVNHWTTLSSPTLDEAIDEYNILAATRLQNFMTNKFFTDNPTYTVLESRYYRSLCYTTCILLIGEKLTTERTTCGDKCCLKTKVYTHDLESNQIDVENGGYVETGGECLGNIESPCNVNVIKITENCNHSCNSGFEEEEMPVDDF